jgi:hypothetical protein
MFEKVVVVGGGGGGGFTKGVPFLFNECGLHNHTITMYKETPKGVGGVLDLCNPPNPCRPSHGALARCNSHYSTWQNVSSVAIVYTHAL